MLSDHERTQFDSLTEHLLRENPELAALGHKLDRKRGLRQALRSVRMSRGRRHRSGGSSAG